MNYSRLNNIYETVWRLIPHFETQQIEADSNAINQIDNPLRIRRHFNFVNPSMRYAYYYSFLTRDTYVIKECWHLFHSLSYTHYSNQELRQIDVIKWLINIIWSQRASLVCFGGGAGTEIVAFCKWLNSLNINLHLYPFIVDKFHWATDTQHLLQTFDLFNKFNLRQTCYTTYRTISDLPTNNELMDHLQKTDVVTVVKFLSALDPNERTEAAIDKFVLLLRSIKSGALVFFMDDVGGAWEHLMQSIAQAAELNYIASVAINTRIIIPEHEQLAMRGTNSHFLTTMPNMSANICAALWRKP